MENMQNRVNCLTIDRIEEIMKLALKNKPGDGTYSDFEMQVWMMMRDLIRKEA